MKHPTSWTPGTEAGSGVSNIEQDSVAVSFHEPIMMGSISQMSRIKHLSHSMLICSRFNSIVSELMDEGSPSHRELYPQPNPDWVPNTSEIFDMGPIELPRPVPGKVCRHVVPCMRNGPLFFLEHAYSVDITRLRGWG